MGKIEELYINWLQSEERIERFTESGIDSFDKAFDFILAILPKELRSTVDSKSAAIAARYEEFGFIEGFKSAMQLQFEYGVHIDLDKIEIQKGLCG